jgi:predicted nucleic acid-binding protein
VTGQPVVYLDSSAIVKLVADEPGSAELSEYLATRPSRVSCRIAEVEVRRAIGRLGEVVDVDQDRVARVLAAITMIELDDSLAVAAGRLNPPALRTLDAIHLASAQELGADLEAFVTYDGRLAASADSAGIPVISPGSHLPAGSGMPRRPCASRRARSVQRSSSTPNGSGD